MEVLTQVDPRRIEQLLASGTFVWIDLTAPSDADVDALGRALALHPLAVEDTKDFGQRPKVDRYDAVTLVVVFAAATGPDGLGVPVEVHLHIAERFLVTAHQVALPALEALHDRVEHHPPRPEDAVSYRVLDAIVDTYDAVLDAQAGAMDALENEILQSPRREQLGRILQMKRAIALLQRRASVQSEVFPDVAAVVLALPGLDPGAQPYLRDVGDGMSWAAGRLGAQASAAAGLADTYFNANADRLTVVSERLTLVATVLLPLTLVTGFFGQNFQWLVDHIQSRTSFLVFGVGGMAVPLLVVAAYLLIKRRDLL